MSTIRFWSQSALGLLTGAALVLAGTVMLTHTAHASRSGGLVVLQASQEGTTGKTEVKSSGSDSSSAPVRWGSSGSNSASPRTSEMGKDTGNRPGSQTSMGVSPRSGLNSSSSGQSRWGSTTNGSTFGGQTSGLRTGNSTAFDSGASSSSSIRGGSPMPVRGQGVGASGSCQGVRGGSLGQNGTSMGGRPGGGLTGGSILPPRGGGQSNVGTSIGQGGSGIVGKPGGGSTGGSILPPRGGGDGVWTKPGGGSGDGALLSPPRGGSTGQQGVIRGSDSSLKQVPRPGGGSSEVRGGETAQSLLEQLRAGKENVMRDRGIPYPKTEFIRGQPAPDKSGNSNLLSKRDSGVMVERPAPIRLGKSERHSIRAGVIINVDGWRCGYWHYYPWWVDRYWFWDYYFFYPVAGYCSPSLYYFYGVLPGYVWSARIFWIAYPVVVYVETPITWVYYRSSYYLERPTITPLDRAISDIVDAWRTGEPALIERHVRPNDRIAIFLNGEYAYSMHGYDFAAITRDAVITVRTKSFTVQRVARRTPDMVVVYAAHTFVNPDDYYETVYVAYTLEWMGNDWYITEAGSSHEPLVR